MFTTAGNQGEQDRMDLLTAVMHELGHLLGHEQEADGVMEETLAAGLGLLKSEAVRRGLVHPDNELDAAGVFSLVRDMPYYRASNRQPETIISEWRGTCSGKHYLLQALFAELGLSS